MIQRVYVQIVDDTSRKILLAEKEFQKPMTNKTLAERIKDDLCSSYPSIVSVEYIDLFLLEDNESFNDISELIKEGMLHAPVILINGMLKTHGNILPSFVKTEVEKLLFSGPTH